MGNNTYTVVSPLMGTFYRASDPDGPPLVEEGQSVAAGEVVCIIESMKIFTEIKTEKAGTVKAVLLDNEDMVMKDQAVIEIETE